MAKNSGFGGNLVSYRDCGVDQRNELTRKTQWVRSMMREEYLEDLVDACQIKVVVVNDGHAHGEKLVLSEFAAE